MRGENDLPAPGDKEESFGSSGAGLGGDSESGEAFEALFAKRESADPSTPATEARRHFLIRIGALAAVSGIGGFAISRAIADERSSGEPVGAKIRYGLFVDADRCARGCDACVRACNEEHGLEPEHGIATDPQWIRKVTLLDRRSGRISTLPLMCQHCEEPPCVDVCPTGASFKRADGIVLVDKHICIGCRYCVMACPFQARSFVHEEVTDPKPWSPRGKGTVESCNFCVHRLDASKESEGSASRARPACVEACDTRGYRALVFGDLNDPLDPVARAIAERGGQGLRPDLALDTKVLYRGV
ncbi:sulfate reduction electron transfer complex DsrMKJOP subunit DsrO [Thioalkalivibrio sp. HK1]|uniref:sulfate reduction electron transfer complex DsrMKJOP subunit DsrO n=1 Tax=Thioalkalivibrio sp. HK1 TaxID=1469245 RepID=UPI000471B417|nr:4Fe-4S dicluster domain-containing protein [Thioalkalivibrio sp. HK1]